MRKKISSKAKKIIAVLLAIVIAIAAVIGGVNIYFSYLGKQEQHGTATGDPAWSADQAFDISKLQSLDMGSEDYKVLVITDIHLKNHGTFAAELGVNYVLDWAGKIALNKLVKDTAPDLILVLGDTTLCDRNDIEYERFVKQMDSYQTPWACVFGNHDDEGRADKAKLVDILNTSEYGMFQYGPENLHGAGNYVIRLTRDGKTEQMLFMMDSGSSLEFEAKTDGINEQQVAWYNWNMEGVKAAEGEYPQNMAFFHIPLPLYSELEDGFIMGERAEGTAASNTDGGLFEAMKTHNGTQMFAAHDHNNDFTAEVDGIKVSYALKSSYNCYFKFGMTGGTLLTISPDNQVKQELIYF